MSWLAARPLLALVLIGGFLCVVGISNHELWTPDEPRVAAIGRAMWEGGSWAVPRLNGEPFLEKPPLYWWAQSALFGLAGRADATLARAPSALFAFASLLLTYALGRRYFEPRACLLGALVTATMAAFWVTSHRVVVDNALVLGTTGALACFAHAHTGATEGRRRLLLVGFYAFLAVAFFSKGIVGLGIPTLGILVFLVWTRGLRRFLGAHVPAGAAALAVLVGFWLWRLWLEAGGAGLETFLVENQLARFSPESAGYRGGHQRPFWYYLWAAPGNALPWTPFVLLAVLSSLRSSAGPLRGERPAPNGLRREGNRLCLALSGSVLAALSLAGTKRGLYLVPVFPALGLLVGAWMTADVGRRSWEAWLERAWSAVLLGLGAAAVGGIFLGAASPAAAWAALAPLVGFGVCTVRRPPRTRAERLSVVTVWVALATAFLLVSAVPFVDRFKSFVPFAVRLEQEVPAEASLYAFRPDETTLGVIGFYGGRGVAEVDVEELARLATLERSEPSIWVVVRDRSPQGGNYGRIQRAAIPHRVVSEHLIGNRRRLRILLLGGDAPE